MTTFVGLRSLSDILGWGEGPFSPEVALEDSTDLQEGADEDSDSENGSLQEDSYAYKLCQKCEDFLKWEKLRQGRLEEDTFFYHYKISSDLKIRRPRNAIYVF
jgi:hypothetical protein